MILTRDLLEKPRTPSELRAFAETVRNAVRNDPKELQAATLKKGLYKQFLDEVLPLSYFAEITYSSECRVAPIIGNQGYDAKISDKSGRLLEYVELTIPHDGAESARERRKMSEGLPGFVRVGDPADDFIQISPAVVDTCIKKSKKDYSGVTLVVVVSVQPPIEGFEGLYEKNFNDLSHELSKISFKAKSVYVFIPPKDVKRLF